MSVVYCVSTLYVFIYIYIYIYVYIYTDIYVYIYIYVCMCLYICFINIHLPQQNVLELIGFTWLRPFYALRRNRFRVTFIGIIVTPLLCGYSLDPKNALWFWLTDNTLCLKNWKYKGDSFRVRIFCVKTLKYPKNPSFMSDIFRVKIESIHFWSKRKILNFISQTSGKLDFTIEKSHINKLRLSFA